MSCWKKCSSSITNVDLDTLKAAANKMGVGINTQTKYVSTSYGFGDSNGASVDGAFVFKGRQLQLGFVTDKKTGEFQVVGDFWGTGLNSESFMGSLGQIYREIQIQQQAELMGYTIDSVTTDAEGNTVIEVYAFA